MSKYLRHRSNLLFILLLINIGVLNAQESLPALIQKLKNLPHVVNVEEMDVSGLFNEKYLILFEQPIDHTNPGVGTFEQYIYLSHLSLDQPVVFVTEGYSASYAAWSGYTNELSEIINANQIVVEHRYFSKSVPENFDWQYLTVENAAADHHEIIKSFKNLYTKKWISTGISKGGQTCLFHRSMYPNDVDISVPYVAPLNFGVEDGRHEPFINQISTKSDRKKVKNFQMLVLEKRDDLFPMFIEYCEKNNFEFQLPLDEIYDYCVLEYSFAFWQWGTAISKIPDNAASNTDIFRHFLEVSAPDYFANPGRSAILPFFIQSQRQLGYYGYETEPFKGLLHIETAKGYLQKVFVPENDWMDYDGSRMLEVQAFLDEEDPKMIFIYGEFDPWSAPAVVFGYKKNMMKVVKKGGSHRTRINNLPKRQRVKVLKRINRWLKE